jgi:hypothetical protein
MAADFFRINRGLEIFSDTDFQTPLIQILTDTVPPDVQADAIAAPVGSLWVINGGTASTTRVYQRFQDVNDNRTDWRDVTSSISWREPAVVCADGLYKPLATKGYQNVEFTVAKIGTDATGLVTTRGTQAVDFGAAVTGATATGLTNDATVYTATVNVDGAGAQSLSIIGSTAQTFATLITQLDIDTANASWSIVAGDLVATSDSYGTTSTILIADTNLFSSITGFVAVLGAIAGTDTTYTASIVVDGGGAEPISINASTARTYVTLIAQLEIDTTAEWEMIDGDLRAISTTTGTASTIAITDATLFAALTNFVQIHSAVTGATPTIDGHALVNGNRVLFHHLAGYDSFFVTPPTLGTFPTTAATDTYDVDVTFDVGGLQQLAVAITVGTTYTAIAAAFNAVVTNGTIVYDNQTSAFVAISNTVDNTSTALLQAGTAGSTGGDLFAALAAADTKTFTAGAAVAGTGGDIYVYIAAFGAFVIEPGNVATDGDAVFVQTGTCADSSYFFNGSQWVEFGSGSAAEEDDIRDFIGKDAAGVESPDYENPTETPGTSEPSDVDPFTDATGQGTAATSNGYVVYQTDNLELAIAKLNNEVFQNNRHKFLTSVTSFTDVLPDYVNIAQWIVYINDGVRVRAYTVFAINDGASTVDFTTSNFLKLGSGNIIGLVINVTSAAGVFTLTVTTTDPVTIESRRLGTGGHAGVGSLSTFIASPHVQAE